MKTLFIVRGLPGSGKSTLAGLLPVNCHFEADQYFTNEAGEYKFDAAKIKDAHQWCRDQVETAMSKWEAEAIAVSNTFTQDWEMEAYFKLAEQYGYRTISMIVENRRGGKSIHGVPDETLQKMKDRFEVKL